MRLLIITLSIWLTFSGSAAAQVVECNGTWTNQPCNAEVSTSFEEVSRVITREEREKTEKSYIIARMEVDYRQHGFNPDSFISDCKAQDLKECRKTFFNLKRIYQQHASVEQDKLARAKREQEANELRKEREARRDMAEAMRVANALRGRRQMCSAGQ